MTLISIGTRQATIHHARALRLAFNIVIKPLISKLNRAKKTFNGIVSFIWAKFNVTNTFPQVFPRYHFSHVICLLNFEKKKIYSKFAIVLGSFFTKELSKIVGNLVFRYLYSFLKSISYIDEEFQERRKKCLSY